MEVEVRKVQQVGYSTLIVSLPREWVKEVGLKQGDTVSLVREDDGTLRVYPSIKREENEAVKCVVDADKCLDHGLLTRIMTGIYVIGHDTIQIESRRELAQGHLEEIRKTTQRLTGISVVEQTLNSLTIQNFVDPTRFPVDGLMRRLCIITSAMQDATIRALVERRKELANEVINMESEVDRIYWLVVRQLLLAVKDRSVGKRIGIESPLHIVGNRTVAKMLEKIGDYSEGLAMEVLRIFEQSLLIEKSLVRDIAEFGQMVRTIYDRTVKAFFSLNLKQANSIIEDVNAAEERERELMERILLQAQRMLQEYQGVTGQNIEHVGAVSKHMHLAVSLRVLVWNLEQIMKSCSTIAEITINRRLEEFGEICKLQKVQ